MKVAKQKLPFLYGVQYYRAPTPRRDCWEKDLRTLKADGYDTVKFWVQWRWSERQEGVYYWDDLDELMELAQANGLRVVLNLILDVMPVWVEKNYPETLMVDRFGNPALTQTTLCRQIGGYPGPCHRNAVMREKRERFTRAAVSHFKNCPALWAWDVWNEPERHLAVRSADHIPEFCYCPSCRREFLRYLADKYQNIDRLNEVWGRCYSSFDEAEVPQDPGTVNDFIDWRKFQLDGMTDDARWRLKAVRELDPARLAHLHIVPDAGCFSALSCVDDFALGRECEIFGSSMTNDPYSCAQALSAGGNRYFYNAEWHINYGSNGIYQRIISREVFLHDLLPQLGWGVRGFLYWQYRSETLGTESPAWGVVRPDGSPRPVTEFTSEFSRLFAPHKERFLQCEPAARQVAIYRSCRNEIYQFCRHESLQRYNKTLRNYSSALYSLNIPFGFADEKDLERQFDSIKLLILPQVYYVSNREAKLFDRFLQKSGVILSEGNLAAYDSDNGYFSSAVPGCGLAEKWGLHESEATSSYHLPTGNCEIASDAKGDVRKALESDGGAAGGEFFPLKLGNHVSGFGAVDFAIPEGDGCKELLSFRSIPCAVSKQVGKGTLIYAGTMLGYGAEKGNELLRSMLAGAADAVQIAHNELSSFLHVDRLADADGKCCFLVCSNSGGEPETLVLPAGSWHELYNRKHEIVPPGSTLFFYEGECLPDNA